MKHNYWSIPNFINKNQIKDITLLMEKEGRIFLNQAPTTKTSFCKYVSYKRIKPLLDLSEPISFINKKAFGFDLYPHGDDNNFIFNKYEATNKGEYKFHTDGESFKENYTIKLTSIINLSQTKYEGGDLVLYDMAQPRIVKEFNQPGTLLVFPSFILHKVTPVTKGTRASGVLFTDGPWWR